MVGLTMFNSIYSSISNFDHFIQGNKGGLMHMNQENEHTNETLGP